MNDLRWMLTFRGASSWHPIKRIGVKEPKFRLPDFVDLLYQSTGSVSYKLEVRLERLFEARRNVDVINVCFDARTKRPEVEAD